MTQQATELLAGARDQQHQLANEIERAQRELAYARKRHQRSSENNATDSSLGGLGVEGHSSPAPTGGGSRDEVRRMKAADQQLKLALMAFEDRERGMSQLEDVIAMARTMEVQAAGFAGFDGTAGEDEEDE